MSFLADNTLYQKIKANADKRTLQAFYCVTSVDTLPTCIPNYPIFIIVNTHSHNLPGEHWFTIYIDEYKRGEVFDSLASPISNFVIRWLNQFTRRWKRNSLTYQHPLSLSCGAFVLYYVLKRLSFTHFEKLLETFSHNLSRNEQMVHAFYDTLK